MIIGTIDIWINIFMHSLITYFDSLCDWKKYRIIRVKLLSKKILLLISFLAYFGDIILFIVFLKGCVTNEFRLTSGEKKKVTQL